MVGKYVRKSNRQNWDGNVMMLALEEIANGMPFKRAAKIFNLPLSTLKRRAKGTNKLAKGHMKQLGRYTTTLPKELEMSLKNYALEMEDRLFGLSKKNICEMAYEVAERNGIAHRFSKIKKAAGTAWFRDFLSRNPELSFRMPEATSSARARGFNKVAVSKFFSILEEVTRTNNITDPTRIYNMDESGIQTVPSKLQKIVAHKGRKQVGTLTSAERGVSVSIVLCVNAGGQFIPPAIIFPRKRRNDLLFRGVPYGTLPLYNESGYMKTDTFVQFLQHFQKHAQSTLERKVLLLLDSHATHKTIEAIEYCRANGIILLSFPPHCTHEMQPLDVAVFSPFMTYYNEEINLWLKNNPGKNVTLYNVGELFGKAYRRAATLNNGLSGFEKTGIFPFNPNVYPEWRFKPSFTTDQPVPASSNEETPVFPPQTSCSPHIQKPSTSKPRQYKKGLQSDSSSSSESEWCASGRSSDEISIFSNDGDASEPVLNVPLHCTPPPLLSSPDNAQPFVTPFEINPLPIAPPQTRSSRPSQGATIFTSTPNYMAIKEKCSKPKASVKAKAAAKNILSTANAKSKIPNKNTASKTSSHAKKVKKGKDDNENDAPCIFCGEFFSASMAREKWIQCSSCGGWAHALCGGVSAGKKVFICDFCN